ncbi:TadE/TadG family type IV pilus assembly protein [Trinickia acidisoli]|uniref:TadE/TadG family type IV pilus assembly protein n=1 Tax=Trinickia acidisoli TaxID=2767482 RepID=UPI001A8C8CEA|nr:TadE/TadG family type IV pilus assembly protein [Trinickia acidisoli]
MPSLLHRGPRVPRHERGAVALEYALVLPMFLAAVFALFQLGFTFIAQGLLDNATHHAARLMRIGTLGGTSSQYAAQLATDVCNELVVGGQSFVPSCAANIQIYVAAANAGSPSGSGFATLKTATIANNVMTQTKAAIGPKYDVILQIGYAYPWALLASTGKTMLVSTLAFQTEPY